MTTPRRFEMNQKLELHSLAVEFDIIRNGEIVTVLALPGYDPENPAAYGVLFKDGVLRPCIERFLRPYPPVLPNGRADLDQKSSWEQFQKATGIDPDVVRGLDSHE
jgi:hypothetical protein